jgi:hypothetical protein
MRSNYLNKKSSYFFDGKRAVLSETLTNLGGDTIEAGSIVTIVKKTGDKMSLNIESDTGVKMDSVWCEYLELVPEGDDLSTYDTLECPVCDQLCKPTKILKNGSCCYTHDCHGDQYTFKINATGELVE